MEISLLKLFQISLTLAIVIGLSWALWIVFRHYQADELPIRFSRMLNRFGIDPRANDELGLENHIPTAIRVCQKCKSEKECDAWQAINGQAKPAPEFCANASYLQLASRKQAC